MHMIGMPKLKPQDPVQMPPLVLFAEHSELNRSILYDSIKKYLSYATTTSHLQTNMHSTLIFPIDFQRKTVSLVD